MRLPLLSAVVLFVTASALSADALLAQTTVRTPTRVRGTIIASSAANACAELAATPSALVNAPEGMALLRLRRELESVAFTLEQQQQLQGVDVQRITQAQRGVDSLMQTIIVRVQHRDGPDGEVITVQRGDSIRTLRLSAPAIEANIRSLQPQITAFIAAAEAQSGRAVSETGYMGVGLLGAQVRTVTPEGVLVSHCDYPVVETVDIGSPASRAGVLAGDTVLAYNGRDLKLRAVNYQSMLVPGETVRLRVKRGTKAREIPVTVVARKVERQIVVMRGPDAPMSSLPPDAPRALSGRLMISSAAPSASPSSPIMSTISGPISGPVPANGVAVLLGAQLSTVDDDFAEVLGLEPGILLLRAMPGSPFAEAGLRSGEIIRAFNGTAVRDVQAMRRAIAGAASRDARLTVFSRANGTRTVTLRW
ncbi:PDZ domain-containing protein [Gemmatimonas groenlandica]|uniref:PDZ domain-containing protein n=1 Tax=Gemmatimonas groenlandica TaxID=2732249 RepID=A0A6M4IUG0_9BACT|nr:PDZ domain-containing protein [Gemmatimonas groenlandica]QJR37805.1 PDZ domain-containing protein [Gemmatimonas groenlandica]